MSTVADNEIDLDPKQTITMKVIYYTLLISFGITLCGWIFNIVRYIYPMQERSKLILLFYILSFINLTCYFIYYFSRVVNPKLDPFIYNKTSDFEFFSILNVTAQMFAVALGWLICCTMYQLMNSIQLIYRIKTREQAELRLKVMYIFATVMTVIQLFLLIVFPLFFTAEEHNNVRFWIETDMQALSYATLLIVYTAVLITLLIMLNKLK